MTTRTPIKKGSKYGNRIVIVDGKKFHSAAEGERYKTLRLREKRGKIFNLECQPRYPVRHPETNQLCFTYIADFRYLDANNNIIVEDVKGMRTPVFILKKKLVRIFLNVHIVEVTWRTRKGVFLWLVNGEME
jgi:hypothetical protein